MGFIAFVDDAVSAGVVAVDRRLTEVAADASALCSVITTVLPSRDNVYGTGDQANHHPRSTRSLDGGHER